MERALLAEIYSIDACPAPEYVHAVLAAQHIVAGAPVENIVALAAQNGVVAAAAVERIVAIVAFGLVFKILDIDRVVDVAAGERVAAADDQVVSSWPKIVSSPAPPSSVSFPLPPKMMLVIVLSPALGGDALPPPGWVADSSA